MWSNLAIMLGASFGLAVFLRVPIAFAIGGAALVVLWRIGSVPFDVVPIRMSSQLGQFVFVAVPLFLLAGSIMNSGGITERLVAFARATVGWISGGLGQVAVGTNLVMAGISGADLADAAATGKVLIPAMKREGYPVPASAAIVAAAASMGPIIPPSIAFIIYGAITDLSVGSLFLAGVLPGIGMGLILMIAVYLRGRVERWPRAPRPPVGEWLRTGARALPAIGAVVVVLGGILGGIFTPTEASAVAVADTFVLATAIYRELPLRKVPGVFVEAARDSASVLFIIAVAGLFIWLLGLIGAGDAIGDGLRSLTENKFVFLMLVNVVLLGIGMFLDVTASLLILGPILATVAATYGVDPLQFGVIFVISITIGMMTPPYGLTMFLLMRIGGVSMGQYARAMWPYLIALLILLILVTYAPALTLWLPG